jgi:[ribosomal protein S5]-alanine N-acetyltransferase
MSIDVAFTHFPLLTTERLRLRQIVDDDAEDFFAVKSDPQVMEFYGDEPHQSLVETRVLIQQIQDLYARREALFWAIALKDDDRLIGTCAFISFGPGGHYAEIGYELNRAYWRRGMMDEALRAMLTYGFKELGLHRIEAAVDPRNEPSENLLRKLGFSYEGNLRQRFFFHDQFLDAHHFGLLKDEWPASK